jgi:dethiobiotin synthetase
VGKTAVAALLLKDLAERGIDAGACKPFSSGAGAAEIPADARLLIEAGGIEDDPDLVAPVRFASPVSPWSAWKTGEPPADIEKARRAVLELGAVHEYLVVEGIGGVKAPLADGVAYLDFLGSLQGRALLVSRAGLGTINHTLLTLEALKHSEAEVIGVVLNRTTPGEDPSEETNPAAIEAFGRTKVLAELPFFGDSMAGMRLPEAVASAILA